MILALGQTQRDRSSLYPLAVRRLLAHSGPRDPRAVDQLLTSATITHVSGQVQALRLSSALLVDLARRRPTVVSAVGVAFLVAFPLLEGLHVHHRAHPVRVRLVGPPIRLPGSRRQSGRTPPDRARACIGQRSRGMRVVVRVQRRSPHHDVPRGPDLLQPDVAGATCPCTCRLRRASTTSRRGSTSLGPTSCRCSRAVIWTSRRSAEAAKKSVGVDRETAAGVALRAEADARVKRYQDSATRSVHWLSLHLPPRRPFPCQSGAVARRTSVRVQTRSRRRGRPRP